MYKVLIVEDNHSLRIAYESFTVWNKYGFEVVGGVPNYRIALDMLKCEHIDLIVASSIKPAFNGLTLLEEMRAGKLDTSVVVAGEKQDFDNVRQAFILGAFDYIVLPLNENSITELLERVKTALDEKSNVVNICDEVSRVLEQIDVDIKNDGFIKELCIYLSQNISKVITADDIAETMHFSKNYFGKVFKKHFNIGFSSFYTMVKIEHAKVLIAEGKHKTYEISELLGFASPDYFTKVFKEVEGVTPSTYKTNLHKLEK